MARDKYKTGILPSDVFNYVQELEREFVCVVSIFTAFLPTSSGQPEYSINVTIDFPPNGVLEGWTVRWRTRQKVSRKVDFWEAALQGLIYCDRDANQSTQAAFWRRNQETEERIKSTRSMPPRGA